MSDTLKKNSEKAVAWVFLSKNYIKIEKGCSEYIQGDLLKVPPKHPKCPIVKKFESSRVGPPNLYENL